MSSGRLPSLPFATRRELIERVAPLYQEASLAQKGLLLDQDRAAGFHRGHERALPESTTGG